MTGLEYKRMLGLIIAIAFFTLLLPQEAHAQGNGNIDGTVYDHANNPIRNATVVASGAGTYSIDTDAVGHYTMSVPQGTYTVSASMTGFITSSFSGQYVTASTTTYLDFHLFPSCKVYGYVNDSFGVPVDSVQVQLVNVSSMDTITVFTNATGKYEFSANVQPGNYIIQTSRVGYFQETAQRILASGEAWKHDFIIYKQCILDGYVNDSFGAPVQGAQVTLIGNDTYTATTNLQGRFLINGIVNGTYDASVHKLNYSYANVSGIVIVEGMNTYDFVLPQPSTILGWVRSSSNVPISGVRITVSGLGGNLVTYTDGSGNYICPGLQPGYYWLEAYLNPNCLYVESGVPAPEGGVTYRNITLYSNGSAFGNVKDETNANIAGAHIEFFNESSGLSYTNASDASGNWNIGGLPVGEYLVTITGRLCMSNVSYVSISEGSAFEKNVVLEQSGGLAGTVTSQLGMPIHDAEVTIYDSAHTIFRMHSNESGYFEQLSDMHGGLYSVMIRPHSGYVAKTFENVLVNEGMITTRTFVLNETAYLVGNVNEPGGACIPNVWVTAFRTSGGFAYASTQTNETGWYNLSLDGLDAGEYEVNFAKAGYVALNRSITLIAGQVTVLDVVMVPYISLHGYVLSVAQISFTGVGGAVIRLTNATGAVFVATSASDGSYNFTSGLLPGNYSIRIEKVGYANFTGAIVVNNAHICSNQNFTIVALGMLQGAISDEQHVPVVGASVTLIDSVSLDVISVATTDITGKYSFAGLMPGIYNLRFFKSGYMYAEDSAVVHERLVTSKDTELIKYLKLAGVTSTMTIYSTALEFSANTEPFANVNVTVNGVMQMNVAASPTGKANIAVNLSRGDNTIVVSATAEDGGNFDSVTFHAYVALPQLSISYPETGANLAFGLIQVSGTACDGYGGGNVDVKVRIDGGLWQNVTGNMSWKYYWDVSIDDSSKAHTIEAMVTDSISGRTTSAYVNVFVQEVLQDRLNMSCPKPSISVEAGKSAIFNIVLKNEGKAVGSYLLNFTTTKKWNARFVRDSANFTLMPNSESALVNFEVKTPGAASPGIVDAITITATKASGEVAGSISLKLVITIPIVDNSAAQSMNLQLLLIVAAIAVIAAAAVAAFWWMRRKKEIEEESSFERDPRWAAMDLDRTLRRSRDNDTVMPPPPIQYAPGVTPQNAEMQGAQGMQVINEQGQGAQPPDQTTAMNVESKAWTERQGDAAPTRIEHLEQHDASVHDATAQPQAQNAQVETVQIEAPKATQGTHGQQAQPQISKQADANEKPLLLPLIPKKAKKEDAKEQKTEQNIEQKAEKIVEQKPDATPQSQAVVAPTQPQIAPGTIPAHVLTQIHTTKSSQTKSPAQPQQPLPQPTQTTKPVSQTTQAGQPTEEPDVMVGKALPATMASEKFYSNPANNEPYLMLDKLKEGKMQVCTQIKPGIYICMTDAGNAASVALREMDASTSISGVETLSKNEPERNWKLTMKGAGLTVEMTSKRYDPMGLDIKSAFAVVMKVDGKANVIQDFLRRYTKTLGRNPYSKIMWTKFAKEFGAQKNDVEELWRKYLGL